MKAYDEILEQADIAVESGHVKEAIDLFQKAITVRPDFIDGHYKLALLYNRQGSLDEAVAGFKHVIDLNSRESSAWNNLGVLYYIRNDFEQAEQAFREATTCDEKYGDAWYGLGRVLVKQDRREEANDALCQCIRWDPLNHKAQHMLDDLAFKPTLKHVQNLHIGFVTIWFERGQSYVTKTLRDVTAEGHETFVFARTGGVGNQPMLETGGFWDVPNLTTYRQYVIPPDVLMKWIKDNRLDVVVFNEEYDWELVRAAKSTGAKVVTYLDYYKDDWMPSMQLYDAVLCSTFRTFYLVKEFCNAYHIGWAVDTDLFCPKEAGNGEYTFFHNAGWLGINYRKMTPAVILAFDAISNYLPDATLFVHSQAELTKLPPEIVKIIKKNERITYHIETLPAPGLYHKGRILVFPSKLEGLGLPLFEGMACGLPAIVTDAPPMNEFVENGKNGILVKVAKKVTRGDHISFPETIVNVNDLAKKMYALGKDDDQINEMGMNARSYAQNHLSLDRLRQRIQLLLNDITKLINDG